MAGGPNAQAVACPVCLDERVLTRAERVDEGIEDDHYECERGHAFGIDWSHGAPDEPQWPAPPELRALTE